VLLAGNADVAGEAPDEELADLAGAPVRLAALALHDQALDLAGELVGVAHRPPRAITERLQPMLAIAREDLVAGLARDAELATDRGHRFAFEKPGDES
jgi:hypothetical protein